MISDSVAFICVGLPLILVLWIGVVLFVILLMTELLDLLEDFVHNREYKKMKKKWEESDQ